MSILHHFRFRKNHPTRGHSRIHRQRQALRYCAGLLAISW